MASFARDTPTIGAPLPWVPWKGGPRWILWPVFAWRVVAPRPRQRKLDLFQKAVLGLCRAGETSAERIGTRLMIDRELAGLIVHELGGVGWLDSRGLLTDRGRRVLEEEEGEPLEEQTVGWVFTDPFSGDIWPRFLAGQLPYVNVELDERGYPVLETGTIGNPKRIGGFAVLPAPDEPVREARPHAEDILRAARAHRRQHDWEEEPEVTDAPALQRVSFVSDEAISHLLAVRTWQDETGDWHVDDPFGVGESAKLQGWIEGRFAINPSLRRWLEPVAGVDPELEDLKSLTAKAAWEVNGRFDLPTQGALHERLVVMQRALLETALPGCPEDKWDDVVIKAQKAAERLLRDLHESHAPRALVAEDVLLNELLLNDLAASAGFETPLPQSLTRVKPGKVRHAARHGSGSLRPLLILAVLGTAGAPTHPLARVGRLAPDLLRRLDELASVRDTAAHEGEMSQRRGAERGERQTRVRAAVETVFAAVKLLIST